MKSKLSSDNDFYCTRTQDGVVTSDLRRRIQEPTKIASQQLMFSSIWQCPKFSIRFLACSENPPNTHSSFHNRTPSLISE